MSPQEKSVRVKALIVGGFIEAATWLLWLWAVRTWPAHPEDTIPMFVFAITQIPSILLVYLFLPLMRFMGLPLDAAGVVAYAVISVVQGFLFAVLAYILVFRPVKH